MKAQITSTYDEISEQAPDGVGNYLSSAVYHIDQQFGKDYAKNNPVHVAAFIQACAADSAAFVHAKALQYAIDELAKKVESLGSLESIASAVRND